MVWLAHVATMDAIIIGLLWCGDCDRNIRRSYDCNVSVTDETASLSKATTSSCPKPSTGTPSTARILSPRHSPFESAALPENTVLTYTGRWPWPPTMLNPNPSILRTIVTVRVSSIDPVSLQKKKTCTKWHTVSRVQENTILVINREKKTTLQQSIIRQGKFCVSTTI